MIDADFPLLRPQTLEPADGYAGSWKRAYLVAFREMAAALERREQREQGHTSSSTSITVEAYDALVEALDPQVRYRVNDGSENILFRARAFRPGGELEP